MERQWLIVFLLVCLSYFYSHSHVSAQDTLPNDEIENAIEITSIPFTITQSIAGATINSDEYDSCVGDWMASSVWFHYTPDINQKLIIQTDGSISFPRISVYIGTPENLQWLHCSVNGVGLEMQAGSSYYISVTRPSSSPSDVTLQLTIGAPIVTNDLISDATVIPANGLPYNAEQDVNGATITSTDPGQQGHSGDCGSSEGAFDRINTVWYSYTPTETVNLIIDARESDVDPIIDVYPGGCGYGAASFHAEVGTTYQIRIAFKLTPPQFKITAPTFLRFRLGKPLVTNDLPGDAITLTRPFSFDADITNATNLYGGVEPSFPGCNVEHSVWFTYTATRNQTLTIDTDGSDFPTIIGFYNATNYPMQCLRTQDYEIPNLTPESTFNLSAGEKYWIAVGFQHGFPIQETYHLKVHFDTTANNDLIQNATIIPNDVNEYIDRHDLYRMTRSADEPKMFCSSYSEFAYDHSIWYRYTPDQDRIVNLKVYDGWVTVHQRTTNGYQDVSCGHDNGVWPYYPSVANFTAYEGKTYYIRVGSDLGIDRMYTPTLWMQSEVTGWPNIVFPPYYYFLTAETITLHWSLVPNAIAYEVQFDTDDTFQTPPMRMTSTRYSPSGFIPFGSNYWRVRAIFADDSTSRWTNTRVVYRMSPNQASPKLNFIHADTPTLTWSRISWADFYDLEIADNPAFSDPEQSYIGVTETSQLLDSLARQVWYWRVRARSADQTGAWSEPERFVIAAP